MSSSTSQDLTQGLTKMEAQKPLFGGSAGPPGANVGGGGGSDPFSSLMPLLLMKKLAGKGKGGPPGAVSGGADLMSLIGPDAVSSMGTDFASMLGGTEGVMGAAEGAGGMASLMSKLPMLAAA